MKSLLIWDNFRNPLKLKELNLNYMQQLHKFWALLFSEFSPNPHILLHFLPRPVYIAAGLKPQCRH
jgi:hypothetical protein